MSEKQNNESALNIFFHCFKSGLIAYLIFMVLSAIFSFLSMKNSFLKENMMLIGFILLSLSAFLCGYFSAYKQKIKGVMSGGFSSVIFMVLIYITLAVASSMQFSNKCVAVIPICLIFGITGAIVNKNMRHKK